MKRNNNLVRCLAWMGAAFVLLVVMALVAGGAALYTTVSILSFVCMAVSMFYWVRFASPLVKNAFTFR